MFRRWLSAFYNNNKERIAKVSKLFGLIILISITAYTIFSMLEKRENGEDNNEMRVYIPERTIISGSDISKEEYEKEDTTVKEFVNYCNEKKIKEAYDLLTNECKEKLYPTLQEFEDKYYSIIFREKREYNLQSWISQKGYNTYKIRFTSDFMSSGDYTQTDKYEDYITIVADENNKENKKININGFIKTEAINKNTKTDELEIEAVSVDTYMNYLIFNIKLKNKTEKDILLDSLENYNTTKLIDTNGVTYKLDTINLKVIDLIVEANKQNDITLRFTKVYGNEAVGSSLEFKKAITDYTAYKKDKQNYEEFKNISIKL